MPKVVKFQDRKRHTLQARADDTHYKRFNALKKSYNITSDTDMITKMIELTPMNSEAEHSLDHMFSESLDQLNKLGE